jgi:hypothetical protein
MSLSIQYLLPLTPAISTIPSVSLREYETAPCFMVFIQTEIRNSPCGVAYSPKVEIGFRRVGLAIHNV